MPRFGRVLRAASATIALFTVGATDGPAQPSGTPVVPFVPAAPSLRLATLHPDLAARGPLYDGERFQLLPIVAIVGDYTFFSQNDASLAQVGEQEDTPDLRAGRFGLVLRSKTERGLSAFVAVDYQERRTRDDAVFQLYDLRLRVPVGGVNIDLGKQKQPFVFEMASLSILNPQQERILSPFFVTRSVGVTVSGPFAGDRMSWSAGWFNDWIESGASFSDNSHDWAARVTGLASVSQDNHDFLHLGLGLRRVGPDAGLVRLSGRPESNVSDKYVDTGEFEADYVGELGLELMWSRRPFLIGAEHVMTRADAPESGNPRFSGTYLMLAWVLTGESRPYHRPSGSTAALTPTRSYGAIELVGRWSHLDLTDGLVDGGTMDKWHLGVNWWIRREWKVGLSWGYADLERDGLNGGTHLLLSRLQWYLP